jgi:uncharacterized membrane protein YkoI
MPTKATIRNLILSKKMMIITVVIIAIGVVAAIVIASPIVQAAAQQQRGHHYHHQGMPAWADNQWIPKINGSVNVANETSNLINQNVKVPFINAAQAAERKLANGRVLGGHLSVIQGYLVYTFIVADNTGHTGHLVIVDAGSGQVLFTSQDQMLSSFEMAFRDGQRTKVYGGSGGEYSISHGQGGWWWRWQ